MELAQVLLAESDENELRKEFTLSEKYAMYLAKKARIGNRHGQRTDKELPRHSEEVQRGQETADAAAQYAGLGSRDTAYRVALEMNTARRHLSPEEVRALRKSRVAKVAELRQQGKSTREIAEAVGVSQTQVVADLNQGGEQGCSPPDRIIGQDNKSYPARRESPGPVIPGHQPPRQDAGTTREGLEGG